jgi:hypothetical protein
VTHVGLVPLSEGCSVDLDDGTLDESVCTDELVIGSVVDLILTFPINPRIRTTPSERDGHIRGMYARR